MKYLVDANVLSEPTKPAPHGRVVDWLRENEREIAVNPIILGELEYGILLLPAGRRRARLEAWFQSGAQRIHTLDFDVASGRAWAALLAKLRRSGRTMSIKDSLIAATAMVHGLTVVTRKIADFRHAGVPLLDPFGRPD